MAKDSGLQRGAPQEWQRQQRAPSPAATSGGTVGAVPTHFHAAGSIVSGQFADERMPDRLSDPAYYEAVDADRQIFSGFWSAHITTSNMPAGAQWACQTIRSGADQSSYWLTQTAHEVGGAYRIYRRVLDAGTWTAWEQIDRTFYDTRYVPVESYQVAQSGAVTPNGTANSTLTGLSQAVTSPGTSAVYMVSIKADIVFSGSQTNIIELLVDGAAETAQLITGAAATGYRFPAPGDWRITGLAAGSRTFTARTRNTAAGTNATVNPTHTLMTIQRLA